MGWIFQNLSSIDKKKESFGRFQTSEMSRFYFGIDWLNEKWYNIR